MDDPRRRIRDTADRLCALQILNEQYSKNKKSASKDLLKIFTISADCENNIRYNSKKK